MPYYTIKQRYKEKLKKIEGKTYVVNKWKVERERDRRIENQIAKLNVTEGEDRVDSGFRRENV